jgi:hypothetical protein
MHEMARMPRQFKAVSFGAAGRCSGAATPSRRSIFRWVGLFARIAAIASDGFEKNIEIQ